MNPFKSFWWAGYECTDKLNAFGNRVDLQEITGHIALVNEDYQNLISFSIGTVREGIRWSQVERRPYQYDWSVVRQLIEAGKSHGIQQIWDLCHFGFPDDLTPLHPMFARRFAALCRAFVLFYRSVNPDETLIITPINEVSFLSWLGGEAKGTSPYCTGNGWQVKYNLMRAYIEGVAAMLEIDPGVRIMTTEPLVSYVPSLFATEAQIDEAKQMHEYQYQATDILCGAICPELGGQPEYLDIIGLNYYHHNQLIHGTEECLSWQNESGDPRWRSLQSLVAEVYERYKRPMALTETSHCGEHKPDWLIKVTDACCDIINNDIPLWGICLYPIIDRPDWDHLHIWHDPGLWSIPNPGNSLERILHHETATVLYESQRRLNAVLKKFAPIPEMV